ncbi:MAG: ketopantoate reductase family protein [Treponema sp.]|jgi:2-dehydropantoate 2-reductase|nr:ketopantoate reductase family protein [Treponema sp.]
MKAVERVLIAGAGAVGLTVADTLYRYDPRCVAILAPGERGERYRRDGLRVNGVKVDFTLAEEAGPAFDLIVIACKNHHLDQVIADLKPFAGPETLFLSLLNGITSEEIIGRAYGEERLPLAMILATDAQRGGGETVFTQRGIVHFGDARGRETGRDRRIAEFFTRTGLPFEYHPRDMRRTLWFKFMVNTGVNQVSALLRLPYGAFKRDQPQAIPEAQELLESAMREVILISRAEGINLGEEDLEKWYSTVALLSDGGYTSMCQDVLAGRKTEVELFSLTVMEYGEKHRISTPVNGFLYRALRAIEKSGGVF